LNRFGIKGFLYRNEVGGHIELPCEGGHRDSNNYAVILGQRGAK